MVSVKILLKSFEENIKNDSFKVEVNCANLTSRQQTDTLLISCVDFRFRNQVNKIMCEILNLADNYDEISLPGASLSLVEKAYPGWGITVKEVIRVLQKLHKIKRIIFLDHRDCGAYKLIKGDESVCNKLIETQTHRSVFKEVRELMALKFPDLEIYTLLMGLDGVIENIKP